MTLEELMAAREATIKEAEETVTAIGDAAPSDEQTVALRTATEKLREYDKTIAEVKETIGLKETIRTAREAQEAAREGERPALYGTPHQATRQQNLTPGELYVQSDAYKDWMARFPLGAPSSGSYQGEGVPVNAIFRSLLGMMTPTEQLRGEVERARALVTSSDASAGDLVRPDWRGLLETGLLRPLTVRQLVSTIPTSTDAIEYAIEKSRVHGAATVEEAAALTGSTGTKPEGGLVFDIKSDTVKTIAEWVAATKRILSDASGLAAYINQYLRDDIALELEDQMIAANGAGEDFVGILNTSNVQTQDHAVAGESLMDPFRYAKRKIRVNARTNPTAVLVNPEDLELLDTQKSAGGNNADGHGEYYGQSPWAYTGQMTMWGVPVVESEAVPAKTALMGDFKRAVLFDREVTNISVGTANDDFLRNIVRVLAEMRAGFGVIRPAAFCIITVRD